LRTNDCILIIIIIIIIIILGCDLAAQEYILA
jgi:hypothetical protein